MRIRKKRNNLSARQLKKIKIRKKISGTEEHPRVSVFRSAKYTYAQIISDESGRTMVAASTQDKDVIEAMKTVSKDGLHSEKQSTKGVVAAKALGFVLAKRASEKSINSVVFDRSGYEYKGRVKAVAEGAREGGLSL